MEWCLLGVKASLPFWRLLLRQHTNKRRDRKITVWHWLVFWCSFKMFRLVLKPSSVGKITLARMIQIQHVEHALRKIPREVSWKRSVRRACQRLVNFWKGVVQYTQLESIRHWYLRFEEVKIDSWTLFPISPSVNSTCRKSFCARLRKYSWSGLWRWVENVVDSSRFNGIDTNHTNWLRFAATF